MNNFRIAGGMERCSKIGFCMHVCTTVYQYLCNLCISCKMQWRTREACVIAMRVCAVIYQYLHNTCITIHCSNIKRSVLSFAKTRFIDIFSIFY